jgi:hypothetical protein
VGNTVFIQGNPALADLDGLSSLASVGHGLFIEGNAALANLDGLHLISALNGPLFINWNENLTNVDGLASLRRVGETVLIIGNPALTQIDGLWLLTHVGHDLRVFENRSLTECGWGLSALLGGGFVGGEVEVRDNGPGCGSVDEILSDLTHPETAIEIMAARIDGLAEAGLLSDAHARALTNKLDSALSQMGRGNFRAAGDKLLALVAQVEALMNDGHVSPEDAGWILAMAVPIIEGVSGMI